MALSLGVDVPPDDRDVLEGWLRSPSLRAALAMLRARIVLLACDAPPDGGRTGEVGATA